MSTVFLRQLIDYVISNPKCYPGIHNISHPRTTQGLPQLDTARQLEIIWKGMCVYTREVLEGGKSVNIKNFGAFTFEPIVSAGGNSKNPRGHALRLRPCFLVAPELKQSLYRYPGKEEVTSTPGSVYQQGTKMTYLNTIPIAAGTYYKQEVVAASLNALFRAVCDLSTRGYNMQLDLTFAKVQIVDRNLNVMFSHDFANSVQSNTAAWPKRPTSEPISKTWQSKNLSQGMMNFGDRPLSRDLTRQKTRTMQLGILSLDLNSCQSAS